MKIKQIERARRSEGLGTYCKNQGREKPSTRSTALKMKGKELPNTAAKHSGDLVNSSGNLDR